MIEAAAGREQVGWIDVEKDKFLATFKNAPVRSDLSAEIREQYVVEYYSR